MATRRLSRLIYSEVTAPCLISLAILTFIVFTREFGQLAELLIRKNADPLTVLKVVAALLPNILIFSVPFAFLIGSLIAFSRLSSDSEIVALRANGVSLYQLLWPLLKIGFLVSLLTLGLTLFLLPRGNWALQKIRHQIGLRPVQSQIHPRVFNEDLAGMILYVEDIDLSTSNWKGVLLADTREKNQKRIILASLAYPIFSSDSQRLQLHFERGSIYTTDPSAPEKLSLTTFGTLDVPVSFPEAERIQVGPKKPREKELVELLAEIRRGDPRQRSARVELEKRLALPLSPLLFAVLAATLGIHTHRGGRGYGFMLSVVIAFSYYLVFVTGSKLAEDGDIGIVWGVWGADLLAAAVALAALRYSEYGFGVLQAAGNTRWLVAMAGHAGRGHRWGSRLLRGAAQGARRWVRGAMSIRLQLPWVIDRYVGRMFLGYFALTLLLCSGLFYLFTFFELVDDIFSNQISHSLVLEYFFYLLPHVLMLLVPISTLIATLVCLGLLEKTHQIMALKSCGISVYRLAAPILVLALGVSGFIFVLQEYVLPYANQRQDSLRNVIKGRPIQTHYQVGRNWIFGEENRLYHYNYYDPRHHVFAGLSIYNLDISQTRLWQHIYAERAQWDEATQGWRLYDGWQRIIRGATPGFFRFKEGRFFLPESPSYFQKEVKESSKMTYAELSQYINLLARGGFEVDHLKTELYKKLSFPLVSAIMVILGIPFAFSLGRKGALHGIAVGVLLGIGYWGTFGVFGLLGSNGLLSPALAAWGPNLLFSAGGVLLLTEVRT